MTTTLITGGAGFIGTNLADRILRTGERVVVLDDLSRPGVSENLTWLRSVHRRRLRVEIGDARDARTVQRALAGVDQVFHFAAQVAVTSSLDAPLHDFEVNLGATITLLDQLRRMEDPLPIVFTSTNKVYGGLDDVPLRVSGERWEPIDDELRTRGIGEAHPLHFCSPYGCSKGGADQYVLDHATSYGVPSVVFRMSCIYGPHQCGNEDQGWVAHFLMRALDGLPITIYGDGRQVRDILFVDDLLDAMQLAMDRTPALAGRAFNIGGGPANTVSLRELLALVADLEGAPQVEHGPPRIGDQRYYVSDTRAFQAATGWSPRVGVAEGVGRLLDWLREHRSVVARAV
jgi:CDP-paratose 2-epimerase